MPALFRNYKQSPISEVKISTWNFGGDYDYGTKTWTVIDNVFARAAVDRKRNEVARNEQEQRRQAEDAARRSAAAERESARLQQVAAVKADQDLQRERFKADLKVDEFVEIKNLYANPYFYRNKRVAVVTRFKSMTAADTAMFGSEFNPIFTKSTRVDRFRSPDELVMLVFKFSDLAPGQKLDLGPTIGGMLLREAIGVQGQVVSGQFVGAYTCKTNDCGDFYTGT